MEGEVCPGAEGPRPYPLRPELCLRLEVPLPRSQAGWGTAHG